MNETPPTLDVPPEQTGSLVLNSANHKSNKCKTVHPCPWLNFPGEAGTLEYAETVYEWMEHELGFGQFCIVSDNDWWFVEERVQGSEVHALQTPVDSAVQSKSCDPTTLIEALRACNESSDKKTEEMKAMNDRWHKLHNLLATHPDDDWDESPFDKIKELQRNVAALQQHGGNKE